jgi:hypothetical protein
MLLRSEQCRYGRCWEAWRQDGPLRHHLGGHPGGEGVGRRGGGGEKGRGVREARGERGEVCSQLLLSQE